MTRRRHTPGWKVLPAWYSLIRISVVREETKPMAKDSIFRMASMTKPIVTVAAMMLVEQGVFKINDPIARYLPELKDLKVEVSRTNGDGTTTTEDLPANRAVTIQDLMRHT